MPPKIHIETYGCQMNDYESDRTYRLFHDEHGYDWTPNAEDADLVLYNTCSIRDKADQKAFSSIGKLRIAKMSRPEMVIAIGGCMAQSRGSEIQKRAPYVDLVFGTHQWAELPELVNRAKRERRQMTEIDMYGWKEYRFLPYRHSTGTHPVTEFVTIQNGCDKFCTFCLVPFTRGREVSRPRDEILEEVKGLVVEGAREVMLLGQNVNAYGRDRTGQISFGELLEDVSGVQDLRRIRFMTSHPAEMTQDLIDRMADNEKICEHLHLPIQSGSDRILERMNRQYTVADYRKSVEILRKKIPGMTLTTDVIVGFPSETDEDFEATLKIVREFDFDDSYYFFYSPRLNTKAAKWKDEFVPGALASERLERLRALQQEIHLRRGEALIGSKMEVLVEGNARRQEGHLCGKTRTSRMVNFPGGPELVGKTLQVKITEVLTHSLKGELEPPHVG